MAEQNDQTLSFSERCGQFLTQNRKPIVVILGAVCAVVAIALIASSLTTRAAKKASIETETIISEWTDLRNKNAEDMTAKEDALVEKLEKQATANGRSYAAFRAYTTLGEIYVLRKDWEKALTFYQKAGEAQPKSYTAGIAYFNAAACADELQQHDKALELYTLSGSYDDFPLKPRALFNIGRLEESLAHSDKAIEAYTKLTELYPDNDWALLAKSRIIALSIQ
ncbi:tetratricopeptide repeat protein [Treponema sp. OMZ 305]|uniref:tetratricopeptide repeat protein n=1 Tax=Treponema sp. OMZ 305 TaxID=1659192 RepID=UPI0020A3887B|nr:tetratricopeptide repeat protein [Treponema sp. OMZ 305]UTC58527.1 tetratricopeptide repeat protein [Treponema sp. OMZ 305]